MPRRKGSLSAPPVEWVELLQEFDPQVDRVRMLWRRGGGPYRPIVRPDVDTDQLVTATEWDNLEVDATHFQWAPSTEESPMERREMISGVVGELWCNAESWTRTRGEWCDFQLVAYGADGRLIFEDGRRLSLDHGDHFTTAEDGRGPVMAEESFERSRRHVEVDDYVARQLKDLISQFSRERHASAEVTAETLKAAQQSFASVQESIDSIPRLLSQAGEVLRDGIKYQREQVEQMRKDKSGNVEVRAAAFREMEKSRRWKNVGELFKHGLDAGITHIVPLAKLALEYYANRDMMVFPEFQCAQQAMAYLVESMTPVQLKQLWEGNTKAAGAMLGLLDEASRMQDERAAIEHIANLIRALRSEEFRQIAKPEEQLAARFIIGRRAMYRSWEFGNGEPQAHA